MWSKGRTAREIRSVFSAGPGRVVRSRAAGFSLIEAVVALAVFSALGAALMSAAIVSFQALETAHREMAIASEVSLAEELIRKSVAAIRFPAWLAGMPPLDEGGGLSVPYLHGKKDLCFKAAFEEGVLTIDAPSGGENETPAPRRFTVFAKAAWEILSSEREEPYGLAFTLSPNDPAAREIKIAARFGSAPWGKVYE